MSTDHFLPTAASLDGRPVRYHIEQQHTDGSIDRHVTDRDEVEGLVLSLTERYGALSDQWNLDNDGTGTVLVVQLTIKED